MTMNQKQALFTKLIAELIVWGHRYNHPVILAEAYRTEYQAREYARLGKGIINSAHRNKLAADLFAVVGGRVSWGREHYEALGAKWRSMHPLCRWGGDFKNRDCVHFSMEHKGVR